MTTTSEPKSDILAAADVIKSGGLVVIGTETFYALAADPFQEQALVKTFEVKRRQSDKPLPLIASDMACVRRIAKDPGPMIRELMDRFWPGSLTILLEPAIAFSDLLTGSEGKIGVRVPPNCPARDLAAAVGGLITSTSANLSGDADPDRVEMIAPQVLEKVDLVVDHGTTPGGLPSTLVEPFGGGVRILRQGAVPRSELFDFLEE
jgi:L-threonylcarbamoyladenylate synthase